MAIVDGNKYIHFELLTDSGKTQDWLVVNKVSGFNLGQVNWYNGWRQYVFQPADMTEFNNSCLDTISQFLARLNKCHRIVKE